MARSVKEWIGRTDDSQPTIHVLLRLMDKQGGICACGCGQKMNLDTDEIDCDHTIPLRDGGKNRESNLQLMFRKHHRGKTVAENIARGQERRHKAKAFTAKRKPRTALSGSRIKYSRARGVHYDSISGEIVEVKQ